jgi:hypothetical protein
MEKLKICKYKKQCSEYTENGIPCTMDINCGLRRNFEVNEEWELK